MKRYEMTYEYNRVGCYDDVIPVESADGEWIKFKDYQAATAAQESAPAELPPLPGCLADRLYEAIGIAHHRAQHAGSVPRMKKWDDTKADLRAALAAAPASPQPVAKVLEEIQELQAEIMRVTAANAILIQRIVNGCTAIEVGAMADNDKSPSDYKQGIAKGASDCLKFIQEQRKRAASMPTTLTEKKE